MAVEGERRANSDGPAVTEDNRGAVERMIGRETNRQATFEMVREVAEKANLRLRACGLPIGDREGVRVLASSACGMRVELVGSDLGEEGGFVWRLASARPSRSPDGLRPRLEIPRNGGVVMSDEHERIAAEVRSRGAGSPAFR